MGKGASFLKMMKGIGKGLATETANLGVLGAGIGRAGYEASKGAAYLGSKAFRPLAEGEKAGSMIQKVLPYKMKTGAAIGIAGAIGLYNIGDEGAKTSTKTRLGEISSGEMANTIGISRSPNLNGKIDQVEADEKAMSKFAREDLRAGTYGAEGDIVFALHNLRGGQ